MAATKDDGVEYLNAYKPTAEELRTYRTLVEGYVKAKQEASEHLSEEEFAKVPAVQEYLNFDQRVQKSFPAFLLFHKITLPKDEYVEFLEDEAEQLFYWEEIPEEEEEKQDLVKPVD